MTAAPDSGRTKVPDGLPSPPFVHVPGLVNLRDAGGYAIQGKPGRAVRRGVIFRSADLRQLEDEGIAALRKLGITHVFDLRSVTELAKAGNQPPETWEGAARVFVPVFLDKDYSPEALALRFRNYSEGTEGFVNAYAAILASAAEPDHPYSPFRTVLEHVASLATPPAPFLVHCTAGKDTLLLALCGVDDATIAHEYSLTELGLAPRREEIVRHLVQGPALFGDRERAERMVGARKEYMLGTLALIRERYGSVEKYVVDHLSVSRTSVERIRQNLVVDLADGEEPLDCTRIDAGLKEGEPRL
ncbi:hypothetical protein L209DRAFT_563763 [Thermothelomyces heterothallicus CBS 203.75]